MGHGAQEARAGRGCLRLRLDNVTTLESCYDYVIRTDTFVVDATCVERGQRIGVYGQNSSTHVMLLT